MKSMPVTAARIVLGLVFLVFGLNGFLHFIPMGSMGAGAAAFFGGLAASGYFLPLLFGAQTLGGVALLTGRFVPLALVVLAPVIVNIVAFHIFLTPASTLGVPILVLALEGFLAWSYRAAFRPMVRARAGLDGGELRRA